MNLEQISEEWRKDASIDSTELAIESLKIPELHSKYLKIYFGERQRMKGFEFQLKELSIKKYEHYNGRLSEDELEELGWEPFVKRLMKNEIDMYMEADKDVIAITMKIVAQKEKIEFLEEVIKNLNQRNFQIKNAIEWRKFEAGI